MRSSFGFGRVAVLISAVIITLMSSFVVGYSQCNTVSCGPSVAGGSGDINGDGSVDAIDLTAIVDYCFNNGPAPASLCNSEINGWCNRWFPCQPTLGDIAQLINHLFAGGAVASCLTTTTIPVGSLTTFPRGVFVRRGTSVTRTFWVSARNTGVTGRRLFGYTTPLAISGIGVTINSVSVVSQYAGPGGVWAPSGAANRPGNRVFGYAVPDVNLTSVLIPTGGSQQIMRLTVNYTCTGPFGLIRINPYAASPAEIPVYSNAGELSPGRLLAEDLEETEFEMDDGNLEIPTTSTAGRGLLVALIILAGLFFVSRTWKYAMSQRSR